MSTAQPGTPLRVLFMGTPPLAATVLKALLAAPGLNVFAVVTQPDQPKGRDLKLQPSAVKELATEQGLPVLQPGRARDEAFISELRALGPELIVVAAYGQILPQALLDIPRHGCLNVHTSLLPKYRGAAPIQWAIINGDAETGVTIMKMDAGLDTGPMVSEARTPISAADNAQTLHDRLADLGGELLVRTIPDYVSGRIVPTPQPADGSTYARKIKKEDGRIDWSLSARAIWNRLRGLTPWPGSFTHLPGSEVLLKVWQVEPLDGKGEPGTILSASKDGLIVACGEGALRLIEVQREGGKRMGAAQFLAGCSLTVGSKFH